MNDIPLAGITVRDRIHRVLDIFADEVGPRLLEDEELASIEFSTKGKKRLAVGQARRKGSNLDAAACCDIISQAAIRFKDILVTIRALRNLRNDVSHPTRPFGEWEAVQAVSGVAEVLRYFRRPDAARRAERYRAGPTIRYVTTLVRKYLIQSRLPKCDVWMVTAAWLGL